MIYICDQKNFIDHITNCLSEKYQFAMAKLENLDEKTVKLVEHLNVRMDKNVLGSINLAARTPCILTRHLLKALFTYEELATRSLHGKKSNAKPDRDALPPLDDDKRNAIFGNFGCNITNNIYITSNFNCQYFIFVSHSEYVCQKHLDVNPGGDRDSQAWARKNLLKVITKSACDLLRETRCKYQVYN